MAEAELHFRFAGGVNTKTDEKTVPTTQLLALENGVFTRATSIKKRNGYETLATIPGAVRLAQRGDAELLAFTDARGYSVSADGFVSDTGAVYSAVGSDRPLVVTGTQQTQPDHATLSGVTVVAWEDSRGGVWWSTLDATSGRVLTAAAQADASGTAPRCVPAGANLHIYYATSGHRIMVIVVDPSNPTAIVTPQVLADDLDGTNSVYDACPTARAGTPAVLAWLEHGTTNIRIGYVDASGVLGSPLSGHASTLTYVTTRGATTPLAIAYWFVDGGAGDAIGLAFNNAAATGVIATFSGGSTIVAIASTSAYLAYSGVSITRCALVITSATAAWAAFEETAAQASNRFTVAVPSAVPAGVSGSSVTIRSVGLASRAFARNGDAFAVFVHDTTSFNVYLTLQLGAGFAPSGRHVPGSAGGAPARKHLSSVHVDGDVYSFALPFKQRLITENNDKFTETSVRLFALDFDNDQSHQYATFGHGLYLAGGCPLHYDGRIWSELGFHVGPELIATVNAGGGSMTSSTTYLYRAWYEWTDAQGEIHLGPTSAGTVVTMGGGDTQVTLTLPTLRVTGKSNVRIMVARSEAADTGNTAQLFRVTSLDPSTAGAANGYVANDPTIDTVTFLDRMSDDTLGTFDEIYTDGGIFSNDPATLGSALSRGKSRLFASDPSDGAIVRYSQPFDDGFGVEWPPDLFTRVDPPAGDVVAIRSFDDREIIWTERAIFSFAGDGPAQDGSATSTGFSRVQIVPGDVGCSDPASVILIPGGYMFKSAKGIYLIDGSGTLRYIGAPVEAFNSQTIRRAMTLPDRTAVVFLTDSGVTLLYDYLFDQWSTFTNHEGLDAVVINGQYHYLRADGRLFRETIGAYSDAGQRITLALQTAWIHMLEQLQGWQLFGEMHLLGTWVSSHQLGVQYQLDYQSQLSDPVWLDATGASSSTGWITGTNANTIGVEPISGSNYGDGQYGDGQYGGTPPGEYAWRLDLYEPAHSIQFRFQDFEAATITPGASFELTELVLIGTALGNVRRPSTAGRSA